MHHIHPDPLPSPDGGQHQPVRFHRSRALLMERTDAVTVDKWLQILGSFIVQPLYAKTAGPSHPVQICFRRPGFCIVEGQIEPVLGLEVEIDSGALL